jgi:hypothetical protein
MLIAVLTTLIIVVALAGSGRSGGLISRRPYNNMHSDASGAREEHLG